MTAGAEWLLVTDSCVSQHTRITLTLLCLQQCSLPSMSLPTVLAAAGVVLCCNFGLMLHNKVQYNVM